MPTYGEWMLRPSKISDKFSDSPDFIWMAVFEKRIGWISRTTPAALPRGEGNIQFGLAAGTPEWPIFEHAVRVFGNASEATSWLTAKCPVLNARPIELLESGESRKRVDEVLNCIEHGMIY